MAWVLARISHTLSAADADCGSSASLRSFGLLDVDSTTPSSPSRRAPRIRTTLCVLATRGCEKCGLTTLDVVIHVNRDVVGAGRDFRHPDPAVRGSRPPGRNTTLTSALTMCAHAPSDALKTWFAHRLRGA